MRCASASVWSLAHSTVPDAGGSIGIPVQSQFVGLCASGHRGPPSYPCLGKCRIVPVRACLDLGVRGPGFNSPPQPTARAAAR
jgi:hypothetical protein